MSIWKGLTSLLSFKRENPNDGGDELAVSMGSHICVSNSTEIPLVAGDTFIGTWEDTLEYSVIVVGLRSDQESAINGFVIEYSADGVNKIQDDAFTVFANSGKVYSVTPSNRYFRIVYTNGLVDQTIFSLQTILRRQFIKASAHRIDDTIIGQDDAELMTSVIKVKSNNDVNEYTNVDVQNPIPSDGDSVFGKDLLIELSDEGDFVLPSNPSATKNQILVSMVSNVEIDKKDSTSNNPKQITLTFARPVSTTEFGIDGGTGNFSNVKVTLFQGSYSEVLIDESTDNTKYVIRLFDIPPVRFSKLLIEFYTIDAVTIGLIGIFKNRDVAARIQALNDFGTVVNLSSTNQGNLKIALQEYGDTPSIDAFDRLRVSEPFTIFDSKQLHDKQPLFWDESIGGSATSVHSSADANVVMTVTASASDYVIRQTKQRFNYQPGKGQLILLTFLAITQTGVRKRIGLFDGTGVNYLTPNNGIFFENDEGTLSFNIAKNGSVTETVTQANWNYDKLDGTGFSGETLDISATQICIIDYEWLGVGRVRVGFVINGIIRYCHYFNHANDNTFTSVYMSTPNLTLRYSIESDGTGAGSMTHICSTVMSEGGIEKTGVLRSTESATAFVTGYGANKYALLGIRLKTAYKDISVIPESVQLIIGTNDAFKWELHLNPVVAGTFTYNDKTNSAIQEAQGVLANTITTDGIILTAGGGAQTSRGAEASLETALRIGTSIAGVQDTLVLVFRPFTTNVSVWATMNYRELL